MSATLDTDDDINIIDDDDDDDENDDSFINDGGESTDDVEVCFICFTFLNNMLKNEWFQCSHCD